VVELEEHMRVRVPGTVLAVLALTGLVGGCATQVHAQGQPDPAMTIASDPTGSPTGLPTGLPTSEPPTGSPTGLPTPTASTPVDPATERRITCLLITPSVVAAITAWNNYVDKKSGTRLSVAGTLSGSASTIDGVLKSSTLAANDPVRIWAIRVSTSLKSMSASLQAAKTPSVTTFNSYKSKLQQACGK
jgi:hypothetical protein